LVLGCALSHQLDGWNVLAYRTAIAFDIDALDKIGVRTLSLETKYSNNGFG